MQENVATATGPNNQPNGGTAAQTIGELVRRIEAANAEKGGAR